MKRTKAVKEEHMNAIAKLYVKGVTQMDMAKRLGVSQGQISTDLKKLLRQWETTRLDDIDRYKNEQLVRINIIEAEMHEAWEKSKITKKVVINKSKSGKMLDDIDPVTGKKIKVQMDEYWRAGTTEEEPIAGDMQYMNGMMWCVQERAKLLGLYAPKKIANTDPTGEHEAQSAKEILGDIIGGILKRAEKSDKQLVEGELLELDGNNVITIEAEDTPELARILRNERIKRLPAPRNTVEFNHDGNIIAETE